MATSAGACAVAILIAAAMPLLGAVQVDQPMRLPHLTVYDDSAALVGQVVGYDGFRPLVLVDEGTHHVLLRVNKDSLATTHRVFYSDAGCSGTAYLPPFDEAASIDAAGSFDDMQGVVYGIGKPTVVDGIGVLFSSEGQTAASHSGNSAWISVNPASSRCYEAMWSQLAFPAVEVTNLDTVYSAPFSVQ